MSRLHAPIVRAARCGALAAMLLALAAGCSTLLPTSYHYGKVDVKVTSADGAPLQGAGLLLYTGVRQMALGTTDGSGAYRFEFVPAGDYGIYLSDPPNGYHLAAGDIGHRYLHVEMGSEGSVAFVLLSAGGGQ